MSTSQANELLVIQVFHRLLVFALALTLGLALQFTYRDVLVASGRYDYMDLLWHDRDVRVSLSFLLTGALPALWLPLWIRRPSDFMPILLYVMVVIPTAALLPHVATEGLASQVLFLCSMVVGITLLGAVGAIPPIPLSQFTLSRRVFWLGFATLYLFVLAIYVIKGEPVVTRFELLSVSEERQHFTEQQVLYGGVFLYLASSAIYAVGPFLIAVAVLRRSLLSAVFGVFLLTATFVFSSHRIGYLALFGVLGAWVLLIWRPKAVLFSALLASIALSVLCALVDRAVGDVDDVPLVSFALLFRTFGNSGFLSSKYFDFFSKNDPVLFTQSFMRHFIRPVYDVPYQIMIGEQMLPDNHANANLWADAFANLSYTGMIVMSLLCAAILWLYNCVGADKDRMLAALLLVLPSLALANTGVHTAILSGGLAAVLLLMALLPYPTLQHRK